MKTAVQQIMLGTVTSNYENTLSVLKRIKQVGYDGIELNRYMIHPTPLFVRLLTQVAGMPTGNGGKLDWVKLIQESNLSVISLHTDLDSLEKEFDSIVQEAHCLKTNKIVITGMYKFNYGCEKDVLRLIERLNTNGKRLKEEGISLLYHNHNVELIEVKPNVCAFQMLIENTNSEYVNFEFDSYWFMDAGSNPSIWMKKLGSRMKLWHVTDRGLKVPKNIFTPILKADSKELGTGNMDLEELYNIAKENNVETVVLESHKNWINNNPLQSIELSAEWLNKHKTS